MKKSAYYSDLFFAFSLTSFVSLFILRFLGVKLFLAIPPCLCLGVACAILLSFQLKKKQKIFTLKKSEELEKNALFFYLCLANPTEVFEFFKPRLSLLIPNLENDKANHNENYPHETELLFYQGRYFFSKFLFREVTPDDIVEIIQKSRDVSNLVLLCDRLSKEGQELCNKLSFTVLQGDEIYRKLKDSDGLPQNLPLNTPIPKITRRQLCFAKNNSKRFFKSGILLSVCSFFTPYSIYYAVTACVFFLVSILVRIYGYR